MSHAPDELLSAMLDGEPADDDAAHVQSCDVCQARLAQLRDASAAIATPVAPPPPHIREAAMRAATLVTADAAAPSRRRTSPLSIAAALLVALLVGGFALSTIGRGDGTRLDENTAFPPGRALQSSAGAFDLAAPAVDTTLAMRWYNAGALGAVSNVDAIIRRASTDLAQPEQAKTSHFAEQGSSLCAPADDATLLWHAALTYNGAAAVAEVRRVTDAQWTMEIRSQPPECSVIATQDFVPTAPR